MLFLRLWEYLPYGLKNGTRLTLQGEKAGEMFPAILFFEFLWIIGAGSQHEYTLRYSCFYQLVLPYNIK
jgi:hypothetical protein